MTIRVLIVDTNRRLGEKLWWFARRASREVKPLASTIGVGVSAGELALREVDGALRHVVTHKVRGGADRGAFVPGLDGDDGAVGALREGVVAAGGAGAGGDLVGAPVGILAPHAGVDRAVPLRVLLVGAGGGGGGGVVGFVRGDVPLVVVVCLRGIAGLVSGTGGGSRWEATVGRLEKVASRTEGRS